MNNKPINKFITSPYLYSGFALITIVSILFYIFTYFREKNIVIPDSMREFIITTGLVAIILLVFGIVVVFNVRKLRNENSFLIRKMIDIKEIVSSLVVFIDANFAEVENNITEQIRELEDNLMKQLDKKE